MKPLVGDIVQFNTDCIWDKCSGTVVELRDDMLIVLLPDETTRMAFGYYEVRVYK